MDGFPWRLVTVDIDGTLTRGHGWQPIALAFGSLDRFESTNRRFHAHEIGEDEHLANLLDLATGHTVREVEAIVQRTPKLAGIREGVQELHARGARTALLSHNPPYVTRYYRQSYGFDDEEGVNAQAVRDGRIGPPVGVRADKSAGLRALIGRIGASPREVVHVGDGWADAKLFPQVGGGVALNSRLTDVKAAADLALTTDDFRDLVEVLGRLRPRG
jgi:phosphoserine phosphatase